MNDEIIGIIGGSGLGDVLIEHLSDVTMELVDTPFGNPAGPIAVGKLGSRKVAFLNRHGKGHKFGPSQV